MINRFEPSDPLRQILDSAVDTGIITMDTEGSVTGWSAGARNLLGWAEEEMVGQTLASVFPSEEGGSTLFEAEIANARSHGRGGGEGWRLRKDGTRIWAVGETTPLYDGPGNLTGFVKILRDRTEQRTVELRLMEQTRALTILNRAAAALARENDLEKLVQVVTDAGVS